jgi:hypothetical protein
MAIGLKQVASRKERARSHAWLAVLLAVLFLYNPYLVAAGSAGGLNICHPASHRATVGSSELDRYPSPDTLSTHVFVAVFFSDAFVFLPDTASRRSPLHSSELLPPQQIFFASLWFRPPPVS